MPIAPLITTYRHEREALANRDATRREKYREYNKDRPDDDAFYGSTGWKRVRAWYIRHHPLCVRCETKGITTPTKIVDHIIPRKQGGASLTPSNLQSLCLRCHADKTVEDKQKYRGRGGKK